MGLLVVSGRCVLVKLGRSALNLLQVNYQRVVPRAACFGNEVMELPEQTRPQFKSSMNTDHHIKLVNVTIIHTNTAFALKYMGCTILISLSFASELRIAHQMTFL